MSLLLQAIDRHAQVLPEAVALQGAGRALTYAMLAEELRHQAQALKTSGVRRLGLLADNGLDWALADLAALSAGIAIVPLPLFFSAQQLRHAVRDSGLDALLTDDPDSIAELLGEACKRGDFASHSGLALLHISAPAEAALPAHTTKITYTSGTTGHPKGVCLSLSTIERVAQSLCTASQANPADRHVCVLPLPTLLENIGGLYVPLLAGATAVMLPLQQVGMQGAAKLDTAQMVKTLHEQQATSLIMVPQMLHAFVAALEAGAPRPPQLRFAAVGGAPVPRRLLERAAQMGLPVFEGYGLSECASVVALNAPGAHKPGSVGKPLPHIKLAFDDDGEIRVKGARLAGYLGEAAATDAEGYWATGDTGYLDDEGYLYLTGRKKNMFITSFGRNVAPEWVEGELVIHPAIAQAAVFGEAAPWNAAVIVPRPLPGVDVESAVAEAVAAANQSLPDYAQVKKWVLAAEPFTPGNGLLTANWRLRRSEIYAHYASKIDLLYGSEQ